MYDSVYAHLELQLCLERIRFENKLLPKLTVEYYTISIFFAFGYFYDYSFVFSG